MTDEQMKNAIRGFLQASTAGDVDKALSFLAADAMWVGPDGTFKGTVEIQRYLTAMNQIFKDGKATETGIGILIEGNIGVIEHNLSGIMRGLKGEIPAVCIYEFKNDKIQNIRGFFDRLALAKQGARGPSEKMVVNMVVNSMEKGFRQKKTTKT
jgi:hypothetical protein